MKKTGPPSSALACADLDAEVAKNKLSLVLFGEQTTDMGKAFLTEAKGSDKASFYHTTADCAKAHGAQADGLMLFRNFDEPKIAYEGKADAVDIEAFVKANSVAQLFEFSDNSVEAIFHNNSPAIVWFGEGKPPAGFEAASKTMKGKILFSYSGISEGIQEQLGEFVGVAKEDMPCIRIIKPSESGVTKFKYEGAMDALTGESVSEFVQNWADNKLTAFRKSEDVPADNDGPVRVVVGTTFEAEVLKSENETLMKFYAPWCGHCTSLAPHWTALGEDVKGIKGLVVAKFDATKNESDGVEVESFPTLKFYKGGNATDVKFNHEDGKQVGSLKNFLIANSAFYKAARPDEKADPALDAKDEEPHAEEGGEGAEGEEGGMPEGDEGDMGDEKDADMSEEQMKKMEEEMDNMSPEEKAKMEKEMADAGDNMEMTEVAGDDAGDVGGEPKGEAEAAPADEKKEDL
jgi:protein disulfide-isomerase A1